MSEVSPEAQQRIDEMVAKLLEHHDSVRVFVTNQNGAQDETESYDSGGGNLYAQLGQIREWMIFQDAYADQFARQKKDLE